MKPSESSTAIATLAAAGLLLLLGCSPTTQIGSPPAADRSVEATRVLRLLSWNDYFETEVLVAFGDHSGVRIEYHTFSSFDELGAKIRSQPGHYDVVVTDDDAIWQLSRLRLIDRLDLTKIPNFANIDPRFTGLPFDPKNEWSVPYMWGTTLVAYRNDKIENPAPSWDLLWDPRLRGRVMVMHDRLETLSVALMALGYPLNSDNADQIDHATARAIEQVENIDVRYGDDAEVRAGFDQGKLWAAMCYSGDAGIIEAENENISFYIPREGSPLWIDSFALVRGSSNGELAHRFINFMTEAKAAAANSNYTYCASPNRAARPFMDPLLLADETIHPPQEVLDRCAFFTKPTPRRKQLTDAAWLKVQRAISNRDRADGR